MLVYDAQLPVLDDKFEGSEVALLAVTGGRVDRNFRRSYAWASHAADVGKLDKIVVVVEVDATDVAHTVGAVTQALFGARLHGKAVFDVRPVVRSFTVGVTAGQVEAGLKQFEAEVVEVKPAVKPVPVSKPSVKPVVKPVGGGNGPVGGEDSGDSKQVS